MCTSRSCRARPPERLCRSQLVRPTRDSALRHTPPLLMAYCSTAAVLACARSIAAPPPSEAGALANFTLATSPDSGHQQNDDDTAGETARSGATARPAATKVVATLGPASRQPAVLDSLLRCGLSCARLDYSNARPLFWHLEAYDMLQEAVARTQRMCAVMLDTKGPYEVTIKRDPATPRPRSGGRDASPDDLVQGGPAPLRIAADQTVVLAGDDDSGEWEAENPSVLPLSDAGFLTSLAPGDLVHVARYLASGMESSSLFLEVQEVTSSSAVCRALTPAVLGGLVTVTRAAPAPDCAAEASQPEREAPPPPSCLCEEDREMLTAFAGRSVDFVALSHAESGAQIVEARAFLHSIGMREARVLAKVETRAALRDFEAILAEADGIIVSRGNLGMAVPIEKVARLQKEIVWRCNCAGKLVLVTRIFDSMADAPRPTRAEATDVANAVLDGVDAFLLGAETVRGMFPVETLTCVLAICAEAEKVFHHGKFFAAMMEARGVQGMSGREAMASTLARVAEKTGARLIVIFTRSGRHAAAVAKWRPNVPVLALFPPTLVANGVRWAIGGVSACRAELLRRGVIPMLADPRDGLSEDAMLRSALHFAEHTAGLVRSGDVVCVSHKLRDDISISVLHVGDAETMGSLSKSGSLADMSAAIPRTPSASDLFRGGRPPRAPPNRASSNFAGNAGAPV